MSRTNTTKAKSSGTGPFHMRDATKAAREAGPLVHIIKKGVRCGTEKRGHATPQDRPPARIVVDASEGFVPLWAQDTTLRWRFQERSMLNFEDPEAAKAAIEELFGEALLKWGDAMPVKFAKRTDAWDFEIVMSSSDDCDANGCVLAMAFFPDQGQHELWLYPRMFTQIRKEQIDTFIHEIGHVFGLRHFFANITERRWRSEIFGRHEPFSIMNYGAQSELTSADKSDLKKLYQMAWSGELTDINGTPIRFVRPFHTTR
jgi:matrixin